MMIQSVWLLALLMYARPDAVVSTDWVAAHLDDPNVRIVDTRTRGYEEQHIPGAVWLDINASRDKNNPPTFLPELDTFVATIEGLGISNDTHIVFYDDRGGIYGTRPWVLLRMIGHENVSIVNGGWPKWLSEAKPTSSETPSVSRGALEVRRDDQWIATADDVAAAIEKPGVRLLDARSANEFAGTDLRGNPRGGAIPSATNLFWEDTLEGEFQSFRPADDLTLLFDSHGLSQNDDIITYCQGGGRGAHELFVLYLMGYDDLSLYLGSMEDWSRQSERPLQ
jgi:thiosulfate/3-mercaptopyruvate sulfurtransferase